MPTVRAKIAVLTTALLALVPTAALADGHEPDATNGETAPSQRVWVGFSPQPGGRRHGPTDWDFLEATRS
jgi:hypothetical protein